MALLVHICQICYLSTSCQAAHEASTLRLHAVLVFGIHPEAPALSAVHLQACTFSVNLFLFSCICARSFLMRSRSQCSQGRLIMCRISTSYSILSILYRSSHPCLTPVLILNQSVVPASSMTAHPKLLYKFFTTLIIFSGIS